MDMTHLSFPEEITANIDHALNLGCTLLLSNILFNHYSNSMKKKVFINICTLQIWEQIKKEVDLFSKLHTVTCRHCMKT